MIGGTTCEITDLIIDETIEETIGKTIDLITGETTDKTTEETIGKITDSIIGKTTTGIAIAIETIVLDKELGRPLFAKNKVSRPLDEERLSFSCV
jgi:hypothetical protein